MTNPKVELIGMLRAQTDRAILFLVTEGEHVGLRKWFPTKHCELIRPKLGKYNPDKLICPQWLLEVPVRHYSTIEET